MLKYGLSYEALINKKEFRTGQMRKIEKKCREEIEVHCENLIKKFAVFGLGPSGKANIIPFELFDFGFLLEHDDAEKIWVLHVTKERAKRRRS
ncbi:MAG: hypothetical protein ABL883_05520 [Terricaulis sp.]